MAMRCIAIDDEPLALRQITAYISKIPFLELSATFRSAVVAQAWLQENETDLIFVDINMPDMTGVEFVQSLNVPAMVIFTTAYAEYAIYELLQLQKNAQLEEDVEEETAEVEEDKSVLSVHADRKTHLVKLANIIYLESAGEYVRLHLVDGTTLVTLFRLKNMESALQSSQFMRVHRSYIVNLSHISGYTKGRIFLSNEDYIPIGENYKEQITNYMNSVQ